MSTQAKEKCPLCLETMDLTDKELKPCKCGYEICLWCWHRIMEMDQKDECGGRCPGCRSIYNKDRILGTSISNQILKEICADKSNLQKEQTKSQKQKSAKVQSRAAEEPIDPNIVRVIQRKLVYIIGIPSELASDRVLRQKCFLGQYGKIENIIIDNIGANQQIPDSGRVYVTFSREEEAVLCIEAVNGYILNGKPLKATFGVTRYCHVWLSNKVCQKPNCSYVHQKASAEDICTKDDVGVLCARLQHLLGMNMKGPQQRSGSTLPSPVDCNSRTAIWDGNSKEKICVNDGVAPPGAGNNNPGTLLAAVPRDLSVSSGKLSSIVNASLHQQNNHESILTNQQKRSASISQELPPLGSKDCLDEQLASNDDKFQASVHLGNGISDSEQLASGVNGTVDSSWRKPHYANIVSQGPSGPGHRFTVLTRELTSADTRSKAAVQVGSWLSNSKKPTVPKDEQNDSHRTGIPRSQRPEEPSHRLTNKLSSATVNSHAGTEENNACSDIRDNPVQAKLMQSTSSASSTVLQSLGGSPTVLSNLSTSDNVSQTSVGPDKLSNPHRVLAAKSQSQILYQPKAAASNKNVDSTCDCPSILNSNAVSTEGKHQTPAQGGGHGLDTGKSTVPGNQISSQYSNNIRLPRSVSILSSAAMLAKDIKGRKRQVCPPGFEEIHRSYDSGKYVSTPDALVQDSCSMTDQPGIISWVSECLEDDGDTKQSNSVSISSTLSSTDTIWRPTQLPGSGFGTSNQSLLSPYRGGMLQSMGEVQNPMRCCCTFPAISGRPTQKSEYRNGSANSYMAPGGYDAFCQTTSGSANSYMTPGGYNGSADAGLNSAQVDLSYPMYTLF
ncbi:uncharacterized protein LOC100821293 isoform X1 [Brachypodium distachyon]|uniref:RING-type domain-containing protein n=2 Tax=Brachypodium distachyon TaxID=15368 RepID=A0A0Q3QP74_BRADI|nr:uncharacterized protein LOC100821293 isoform X1 [Brachypodium distachyon]KQK03258.1 hypothetical protein BRADI_2g06660v3 [Brachypodium distachyon]|eukprot:XP_014753493.1 uncharacterized protein LOC100821293 isoform X1 [Brachypodium distachyon]